MSHRKRTARRKLSPVQFLKGSIIRLGLARKVKARDGRTVLNRDGRETNIRFEFIWRRVALVMLTMAVLGWVSLATGAYFFVKYARDFPEVRYVDIFFPHRWDHYRIARGDYYIAKAQEMLEAGRTLGVIHLVRVGVQQSPDNKEGRLMLAQIHHMLGRPDLGIEMLRSRAEAHADDADYLGALISLMFANHEDAAVEEFAMGLLGGSTEPTERNLTLAVAAATANFNRGNYDRAQEIIDEFDLMQSRTGTLLQARIDWELGDADNAIALLERIMTNPGAQEAQVIEFLIEYLWSSGRQRQAEQFAFVRFMADPLAFGPRLRLLYIYEKRNDLVKLMAETEIFFRLFADEEAAMQGLAQFAAQTANAALAERVYEHSRDRGYGLEWLAILLLEAHVAAGEHRGALDFYLKIEETVADWTPLQRGRLQPLLTTAYFGVGNRERASGIFGELLVQGNTSAADLTTLSERLAALGEFARAREVLHHIYRHQPLNQEALTRLILLDIERGNNREIVGNLQQLLDMRKPSLEVIREAIRHISSDQFMFQPARKEMLETLEAALVSRPARAS